MKGKSDFKRLVTGSVLWRGAYFLTLFLINVIISRYFTAAGSGWIFYISSYFSFVLLLGSFSLEAGMAYYGARKEVSFQKLTTFGLAWSLLAGMGIVAIAALFYKDSDLFSYRQIIFFSAVYIPGVLLTSFYCALFFAKQDFITPNLVLIAVNIILVVFLLVEKLTGDAPFHMVAGYFISFLLQGLGLAVIFHLRKEFRFRWTWLTRKELEKIILFSWPAFLGNLIYFLLRRVDYYFINNICDVCGTDDLGNYIQVSKIIQLFLLIPSILASSIFPITAAGGASSLVQNLQKLTRLLFSLTGLACAGLAGLGYWLFPLLFGPSFDLMFVPFLISIPGILALSCLAPLVAFFSGKKQLYINIRALLLAVTVMVIGDILLIPLWGIKGAALISSVSYTVYYAFMLLVFSKKYNLSLSHLFFAGVSDIRSLFKYDQK